MITSEEAISIIINRINPLGTETVNLENAIGRVISKDIIAKEFHPYQKISAMDGYAIKAQNLTETRQKFELVGVSSAGKPFAASIKPDQAIRIFTGAKLPDGSDTVVIQENAKNIGDKVYFNKIDFGRHIRQKGQDFKPSDKIISAPQTLSFRHIGLLAADDRIQVEVYKKPKVAIISTGDEIVMPGDIRKDNQFSSANGPALEAFVKQQGGITMKQIIVNDNINDINEIITLSKTADLIVTSGGASVGDKDLMNKALKNLNAEIQFNKVSIRPGKPIIFAHISNTPILCLPGNPVSSMICSIIFLGPAINKLQGLSCKKPLLIKAKLTKNMDQNGDRKHYIRATLEYIDSQLFITPNDNKDSSMISVMAKSNALIVRSPSDSSKKIGQDVEVMPLEDSI